VISGISPPSTGHCWRSIAGGTPCAIQRVEPDVYVEEAAAPRAPVVPGAVEIDDRPA
jgi:hypothetical protein